MLTKSQLIDVLRHAVEASGSQKAFADQHALSEQYVGDVLHGRRDPGQKILAALGYERLVFYRQRERDYDDD